MDSARYRETGVVKYRVCARGEFNLEFDEDELARHGITTDEVVEVIWNGFDVRRNKRIHGGYQLIGSTDGGRRLKLIAYEKRKGLIRVITGWDI